MVGADLEGAAEAGDEVAACDLMHAQKVKVPEVDPVRIGVHLHPSVGSLVLIVEVPLVESDQIMFVVSDRAWRSNTCAAAPHTILTSSAAGAGIRHGDPWHGWRGAQTGTGHHSHKFTQIARVRATARAQPASCPSSFS